ALRRDHRIEGDRDARRGLLRSDAAAFPRGHRRVGGVDARVRDHPEFPRSRTAEPPGRTERRRGPQLSRPELHQEAADDDRRPCRHPGQLRWAGPRHRTRRQPDRQRTKRTRVGVPDAVGQLRPLGTGSLMRTLTLALLFFAQAQTYPPPYPRAGTTKLLENDRVVVWDVSWLRQAY